MNLIDWIVLALVALIVIGVLVYIHRQKKKGVKCIGCPDSKVCSGNCAGCCACCHRNEQ